MSPKLPIETAVTTPAARAPNRGAGPLVSSVVSGLLLWTTFPPTHWRWLAWIALVPMLLLVKSTKPRWSIYLGAWAGGLVFWMLALNWVRLTDQTAWIAWVAMALALSGFWPLFLAITRLAVIKMRLPLMIAAPLIWVADEYARAYFLTGFPWYYLAHSQHSSISLIQISDFTGSLGVSFLIVLVNAWIADLLSTPLLRPTPRGSRLTSPQIVRLASVATLIIGVFAYGQFRLATSKFHPGPRVALLQSNMEQGYKERARESQVEAIFQNLVQKARYLTPAPDLIVWPETSYPFSYIAIDPAAAAGTIQEQLKAINPELTTEIWKSRAKERDANLHGWTDAIGIPMIVGSITYDHRASGFFKFNSAILLQPAASGIQSYHKLHLVPFGEYVPLIETFPWLTIFTPYHNGYIPSLAFGREPTVLDLGNYKIATAICFEDTVPHVVRRFFQPVLDRAQPDILINLSNDGWFHGSAEHDMHLAISVFRAIENRVPLVRSVNTGISAIIDGNGNILDSIPKLKEGILSGVIPLDDREAFYSRSGDWLGLVSLAITIGFVPLALSGRVAYRRSLAT